MMWDHPELIAQIKRDEGDPATAPRLLKMYLDSENVPTIGVGHNLRDRAITLAAADQILYDDLLDTERELVKALPWAPEMSAPRYGALLNMAFNLGISGLLKFKNTLAAFKAGDWDKASEGMLASKWARQVGPRATRLAQQVREDRWV